jgi:mono/diheme cytochrome c family protein
MRKWASTEGGVLRLVCACGLGLLSVSGAGWLVAQTEKESTGTAASAQASNKKKARPDAANQIQLINSIKGADLFKAYCASCHGADAKGNGPMANSLKVKPPDLTRISERNSGTFPFVRIQRIISGEQQLVSGHGSREMPVWGPIFSQVTRDDMDLGRVRIDNLTRYLQGIQPMEPTH